MDLAYLIFLQSGDGREYDAGKTSILIFGTANKILKKLCQLGTRQLIFEIEVG